MTPPVETPRDQVEISPEAQLNTALGTLLNDTETTIQNQQISVLQDLHGHEIVMNANNPEREFTAMESLGGENSFFHDETIEGYGLLTAQEMGFLYVLAIDKLNSTIENLHNAIIDRTRKINGSSLLNLFRPSHRGGLDDILGFYLNDTNNWTLAVTGFQNWFGNNRNETQQGDLSTFMRGYASMITTENNTWFPRMENSPQEQNEVIQIWRQYSDLEVTSPLLELRRVTTQKKTELQSEVATWITQQPEALTATGVTLPQEQLSKLYCIDLPVTEDRVTQITNQIENLRQTIFWARNNTIISYNPASQTLNQYSEFPTISPQPDSNIYTELGGEISDQTELIEHINDLARNTDDTTLLNAQPQLVLDELSHREHPVTEIALLHYAEAPQANVPEFPGQEPNTFFFWRAEANKDLRDTELTALLTKEAEVLIPETTPGFETRRTILVNQMETTLETEMATKTNFEGAIRPTFTIEDGALSVETTETSVERIAELRAETERQQETQRQQEAQAETQRQQQEEARINQQVGSLADNTIDAYREAVRSNLGGGILSFVLNQLGVNTEELATQLAISGKDVADIGIFTILITSIGLLGSKTANPAEIPQEVLNSVGAPRRNARITEAGGGVTETATATTQTTQETQPEVATENAPATVTETLQLWNAREKLDAIPNSETIRNATEVKRIFDNIDYTIETNERILFRAGTTIKFTEGENSRINNYKFFAQDDDEQLSLTFNNTTNTYTANKNFYLKSTNEASTPVQTNLKNTEIMGAIFYYTVNETQ